MKYQFPKQFLWGSAFSGPQTEGAFFVDGKSATIWDHWFKIDKHRFYETNNVKNDFYYNYKSDIKIAADLKFNSLRTSIQWARLIPDGVNVNQKAVDFYNNVINEMIKNNIEPIVNLHHFDMPLWAQEIGGWENREVVEKFAIYAKTCFTLFADRVKKWSTFNEPIVTVEGGYLYDWHYPNIVDMKKAMQVQWNSLIAHLKAVCEFRHLVKDGQITMILNITPAIPRSDNPLDIKASQMAELFQNRCYLDPIIKGEYPKELFDLAKKYKFMWDIEKDDFDLIANKNYHIDFLGINYYSPLRVKAVDYVPDFENGVITPHYFFTPYQMPNCRINPYRGWEIFPKAVYLALKNIQENYNNIAVYIAENGMGVQDEKRFEENGVINDQYRIDFIKEHLVWIAKAISEGANCFGYHMWTYIDNWSWCNAYKNRYGFVALDLETQKRTYKKSANFIKTVITNNSVEYDDELF